MSPRFYVVLAGTLFASISAASAQIPVFELTADGQVVGSTPQIDPADPGLLDVAANIGVTIDDAQTGMTNETVRFFRTSQAAARIFCAPIGGAISSGQRTLRFKVNYDSPGSGAAVVQEGFDCQLLPSNINVGPLLQFRISGNNVSQSGPNTVLVNSNNTFNALAFGQAHEIVMEIDIDAKTVAITANGNNIGSFPWMGAAADFALIQFQLTTRTDGGGETSGEAHMDAIILEVPGGVLQEWTSPADGSWDTPANWSTLSAPTSGSVFIRQSSANDYAVDGPAAATSLDTLLIANTGGGEASLKLAADMTLDGLSLNIGSNLTVPDGVMLTVNSDWQLNGTARLDGGTIAGSAFSNTSGMTLSGFGDIQTNSLGIAATNATNGTIVVDGGTLAFHSGELFQQGALNVNGQRLELLSGATILQPSGGTTSLNGGTLHSTTSVEFQGPNGRFDGPGTLELSGRFCTGLDADHMNLADLKVVLVGNATIEATSEDRGTNNHTLVGLLNVIERLAVGANTLTIANDFDNDTSTVGTTNETAIYVKNLDLTGATADVAGGVIYYETLVGGSDNFVKYVPLSDTVAPPPPPPPAENQPPFGSIVQPAGDVTIEVGQSVTFQANGGDSDNNLPVTFEWDFGGGAANTSVEDPGAVQFNTAGVFVVSLTVTDSLGLDDPTPARRTITVNAPAAGPGPSVPPPDSGQDGTTDGTGNACGVCGPVSPFFSVGFVGAYSGLLLARHRRHRRAVRGKRA